MNTKINAFNSLVGATAFISRVDENGNAAYNSGRYFITEHTENIIQGVKIVVGYEGQKVESFVVTGPKAFSVENIEVDDKSAFTHATALEKWAKNELTGTRKPQYVSDVYHHAFSVASLIRDTVAKAQKNQREFEKFMDTYVREIILDEIAEMLREGFRSGL